jgi:excisionase family DNA binding protein
MSDLLTPKQVARAIGVSESSLKRWCDRGLIPMSCTVGGHRRLSLSAVLEFLRSSKHPLLNPDAIGLPPGTGKRKRALAGAADSLRQALIAADEGKCRQVVLDLFLEGHRLSRIFDEVVAPAFHKIGDSWGCGEVEIYRERRACRICVRVLHELRSVLSPPAVGPIALGGTPEGDFYDVPTMLVELVLRENGWQAASLGSSLPVETLIAAIQENQPKLFWLSVSHIADAEHFVAGYRRLYEAVAGKTSIVVGGRALTDEIRKQIQYAAYCDNLQHLEAYLASLPAAAALPE